MAVIIIKTVIYKYSLFKKFINYNIRKKKEFVTSYSPIYNKNI